MKRTLITFAICLIAVLTYSFVQPKKLTVSGSIQDWQNVLEVVEQSNAPHSQVKAIQAFIISQLNEQMKADSTKVKKP